MQLQTITQLGNSDAVIIPATLMKDIGLKRCQKVIMDRLGDTENLVIITKPTKKLAFSRRYHLLYVSKNSPQV